MTGPITDVNVTLHRVGHTFPSDIAVLLVSPSGDTVKLMQANCGDEDIEDFTWIFDQQTDNPMPRGASCPDFVYRPNPSSTDFAWSAPAPPGPHGVSLSDFNNEQANGTWSLFVADFGSNDTGDIEGGWSLSIETGPFDMAIPGTGTSGSASLYPATRTVSGKSGQITDVNVTIDGIWHENPEDLDLLLVGPQGQKVVLMSGACGPASVSAYGWVWDDEAAAPMPEFPGADGCSARFHRPSGYEHGNVLPTPAPAGPYAASLSAFDGTDPNGEWSLYVNDDADGGGGFFTNRFQLGIATVPRPNTPPVALRDLYEGREDRVLSRSAPGALRNDSDDDGDKLTAAIVRRPEHGRLDLSANGSFTYRPNRNFNGRDTFVYRARDGKGGTDRATVTIRIIARPG